MPCPRLQHPQHCGAQQPWHKSHRACTAWGEPLGRAGDQQLSRVLQDGCRKTTCGLQSPDSACKSLCQEGSTGAVLWKGERAAARVCLGDLLWEIKAGQEKCKVIFCKRVPQHL